MNFHILTLFPEMVMQGLGTSIIGRAVQQNIIGVEATDIRRFTEDKHGRVDDYTYGGGAGMLMQAQPVYEAFVHVRRKIPKESRMRVIYVTPQGRPFTQKLAGELAESDDLVLLCGHYEGIDERVLEEIVTDEISIGDYVLTGGELAAMVIVDAVARLVPEVLHNETSARTESFHGGLLEYPQYSRPRVWHGKPVPEVLLSGNQRQIDRWRREQAEARSAARRPDLYAGYRELMECAQAMQKKKLCHMDMIEQIHRGGAQLLARQGGEILLADTKGRLLYHTCLEDAGGQKERKLGGEAESGGIPFSFWQKVLREYPVQNVCLHRRESVPILETYGFFLEQERVPFVCTRREQLPICGLYGADGRVLENGIEIRMLDAEKNESETAAEVAGVFVHGVPAGTIVLHGDGSIGLPEVRPSFEKGASAAALLTFMCNRLLRQGLVPYGYMDAKAEALVTSLGLCIAKEPVYWMRKETQPSYGFSRKIAE